MKSYKLILFSILSLQFSIAISSFAQPPGDTLTFYILDQVIMSGQEIVVPIQTTGFTNILSIQGTITYDPAVISYIALEQFGLPALAASNFGLTQTASGIITFSWNDPNIQGQSISDGSNVFAVRFLALGNNGQQTTIQFSDNPTDLEFVDGDFNILSPNFISGIIFIESTIGINDAQNFSEDLLVFPNPVTASSVIYFPNTSEVQFRVSLFNSVGEEMNETMVPGISRKSGWNSIFPNSEELATGIYFLQISENNHSYMQKIIIGE